MMKGYLCLMITHDAEIAAHAKRMVMIRDGEVCGKRGDSMSRIKKVIIVLVIVALVVTGAAKGLTYMRKSNEQQWYRWHL